MIVIEHFKYTELILFVYDFSEWLCGTDCFVKTIIYYERMEVVIMPTERMLERIQIRCFLLER